MAVPALKHLEPPAAAAPIARFAARPTLFADHLVARPIVERPARVPRHLLLELARVAFIAVVVGAPVAVLLKATS